MQFKLGQMFTGTVLLALALPVLIRVWPYVYNFLGMAFSRDGAHSFLAPWYVYAWLFNLPWFERAAWEPVPWDIERVSSPGAGLLYLLICLLGLTVFVVANVVMGLALYELVMYTFTGKAGYAEEVKRLQVAASTELWVQEDNAMRLVKPMEDKGLNEVESPVKNDRVV